MEEASTVYIIDGDFSEEPVSEIEEAFVNWKVNFKLLLSATSIPIATTIAKLLILRAE